jgi:DNA-directed RNA polymerase specialized sigma24 family protein
VDHARAARAENRGGGAGRVSIQLEDYGREGEPEQWLELSDCLDQLEREDPRAAEVARLRLFAGLEFQALAETLELSERTVLREWAFARARLGADLGLSGAEN